MISRQAMKRFLSLEQMCDMLSISRSRYYEMRSPKSAHYDDRLPKPLPAEVFNDSKQRFYSEDVEKYVVEKLSRVA